MYRISFVSECILLENLTHVYRVPNVLDLKMGTRQYGDDAPESKRRSQTRKALHTTTPRLGVRLAGMQVTTATLRAATCLNASTFVDFVYDCTLHRYLLGCITPRYNQSSNDFLRRYSTGTPSATCARTSMWVENSLKKASNKR